MNDYKEVTRFEVVDRSGRVYSNWNVEYMEFSLQDDGKTLKVILKDRTYNDYECDI